MADHALVHLAPHRRFDRPILRWAGGKSHLLRRILRVLPGRWVRYVEPMAGGASLFFALKPQQSILGDINPDLIGFYRTLRDHSDELIDRLLTLRPSKRLYYELRSSQPSDKYSRALRFAYLNRLCWNGVYRVNRRGEFNVPIGDRRPTVLWRRPSLETAANTLQTAELVSGDFSKVLRSARRGDLVFLDPPYPRGSEGTTDFARYSAERFSSSDHLRLARWIQLLTERGAKVILVVSDQSHIRSLYPRWLEGTKVVTQSLISCDGKTRRPTGEVILRNYSS